MEEKQSLPLTEDGLTEEKGRDPFTSAMSRRQALAALLWLPVHILILPALLGLTLAGRIDQTQLNFICYAAGAAFMLLSQRRFLAREFAALRGHGRRLLREVVLSYVLMMAGNWLVNSLLFQVVPQNNPNNDAVLGLAENGWAMVLILAIFLAPLLEELMFRGAVFGLLRRKSRFLGYTVSILLFALYHVWGYALQEPIKLLYMLQYLPISFLLCRCYERCNSLWGSVFLHMLVNALALLALDFLQKLA